MKSPIVFNGILSVEEYLLLITGKHYDLSAPNRFEEIADILRLEGHNDLWDFPLDEIDEVIEAETSVILVRVPSLNEQGEEEIFYRWFEVDFESGDLSEDEIKDKIKKR